MDEQILTLAEEIMTISKNSLIVSLRYMDSAFSKLIVVQEDKLRTTATEGQYFFYNPEYAIRLYKADKNGVSRAFLHSVLHCIFDHHYIAELVDKEFYNLAADIAVENTISELGLFRLPGEREEKQKAFIATLKQSLKALTKEKIYHYLLDSGIQKEELKEIADSFHNDDHFLWWAFEEEDISDELEEGITPEEERQAEGENQEEEEDGTVFMDIPPDMAGAQENEGDESGIKTMKLSMKEAPESWKDIGEQVKMKLLIKTQDIGTKPGSLTQNIEEAVREEYDYAKFLKRFSVLGESIQINEDEFDYIFYTYGLQLYDKMPLIEPLEYKEVVKIRDFVIAIDTSGSVSGEIVQAFINKTYSILSQARSFFDKVNIRIIQCDMEIQSDYKITCLEDFENYLKNMELRGFGGTDFRPVFDYVDKLIDEKQFSRLKGLIYFTDGLGVYPEKKPKYDCAFVFLDDAYNAPAVPDWAIRVLLTSEDIKKEGK
ncbi:MAG: VWA-like domain-containing protein [Clostridiaceae bacterium]